MNLNEDPEVTSFDEAVSLYWKANAKFHNQKYTGPPGLERSGSHYGDLRIIISIFNEAFPNGIDGYEEKFIEGFNKYFEYLARHDVPRTSNTREERICQICRIGINLTKEKG